MVPRETEAGKRAPSLGSRLHKQLRGSRRNGGGSSVQNAKQTALALFIYPTPSTLLQISQVGINEVRIQRRDSGSGRGPVVPVEEGRASKGQELLWRL